MKMHFLKVLFFPFFIFCTILLLQNSYALEYLEELDAHILKINDQRNRLIINRGIEDAITMGDIAKINSKNGHGLNFAAINVQNKISEWVMIQNQSPNFLHENDIVLLKGLYGKHKPSIYNLEKFVKTSFLDEIQKKQKEKELEIKRKKDYEKLLAKNFRYLDYKDIDTNELFIKFKLAPFTISSPLGQKYLHYGIDVGNLDQSSYIFQGHIDGESASKYSKEFSKNYRYKEISGDFSFQIKKFWEFADYASIVEYQKKSYGVIHPIRFQLRIGPFGLKYNLGKNKRIKQISLSYIPLIEYSSYDVESIRYDRKVYLVKMGANLRHRLDLYIDFDLHPQIKLDNHLIYQPLQQINTSLKIELDNADFLNQSELNYKIYKKFSCSYINKISWDSRRHANLNMPSFDLSNMFVFNYTLPADAL